MRQGTGVLVVLLTLVAAGARAERPTPVSPGSQAGMTVVSGQCPTFSWTAAEGVDSVDLVIYRVSREDAEGPPERVLSVTLPGSAQGWTPSLGQCLESGGRYAWSVGAGGDWSEASLFQVSTAPSVAEVEEAMAVLRRYVETGKAEDGTAVVAERTSTSASSESTTARPWNEQREWREPRALLSGSVGAGPPPATVTPPGSYDLSISGDFDLGGYIFKDGYPLLHTDGGYFYGNTALGLNALISSTRTSAPGSSVPQGELGSYNTALGHSALRDTTTGLANTAVGIDALRSVTGEGGNTAVGAFTLKESSGRDNTAVGSTALRRHLTGNDNTAIGTQTLFNTTLGSRNIAVGQRAGMNLASVYPPTGGSSYSDNIFIGNYGTASDEGVIRIGKAGTHLETFIAGISGSAAVGVSLPVVADSSSRLLEAQTVSADLTFTSTEDCQALAIGFTGASLGDMVLLGPPGNLGGADIVVSAWVFLDDFVAVRACAISGTLGIAANGTYTVAVFG